MLSKLFRKRTRPAETPEEVAARFSDDLINTLNEHETHSYVFTRTPRGLLIEEEGQSLEYSVTDALTFDYIVRYENGDDPAVHTGLSEHQFGAELASYMHDTLTGWTENYHLERRRKLGLD